MIITKTPFRISFFGGGTDYPEYYNRNPGAVFSTTIDKYCYIQCRYLPPFFPYKYRIRYSEREEISSIDDIKHPSVRNCIKYLNMDSKNGIEMVHTSDIPAQSGMGSSSAFTVGFLKALHSLKGEMISAHDLAKEAIHVEQNIIKEIVGSQDQIAAAYGGLNIINFIPNKTSSQEFFSVTPITIPTDRLEELQNHLLLFFSGLSRTASDIAGTYNYANVGCVYKMVFDAIDILTSKTDITELGELLNQSWKIKQSFTSKMSNSTINQIYEKALFSGAIGGKLLGAGGGGCILIFAEPKYHIRIKESLSDLIHIPFKFENLGSQIIYYAPT